MLLTSVCVLDFQLAIEAKIENVGIPDEMWDKLHESLIHLMKFSKERCKNFHKFYSRYMENLDSTLKEEERKGTGWKSNRSCMCI